jgi:hypothetical protein
MRGSEFDEAAFFRAIAGSGARALLVGRRALVLLGLTADYDFWIDPADAEIFNQAAQPFGLEPTHTPDEARARRRYVLQNDEKVDVLLARSVPAASGSERVVFDELWSRRRSLDLEPGVTVAIPSIDDLIATKRIASRPKDLEDIRLLEILRSDEARS